MSLVDDERRAEADALDVEILVDGRQFLAQRDEVLLAAQQPPQQPGQLDDEHARRLRLRADQRRDRRQRVEQEVRVDLIGERLDARRHQQLLLLGEPVLDARAVPDLDRNRDAQHGREQDERPEPPGRGSGGMKNRRVERITCADRLPDQLEQHRRRHEHDLPIEREPAEQAPGGAVQLREEERREAPDFFLRADLAQAAAGKSAADRRRAAPPTPRGRAPARRP